MTKRLPAVLALSLLSLAASAQAAPPASSAYLVQLTLRQGDTLIGSPRLMVAAGQAARATATNADGARYDVSLSLSEREGSTYFVKLALDMRSAGGRAFHAEPAALVRSGEPAGLMLGDEGAPLSVGLTVTPVKAPASL